MQCSELYSNTRKGRLIGSIIMVRSDILFSTNFYLYSFIFENKMSVNNYIKDSLVGTLTA